MLRKLAYLFLIVVIGCIAYLSFSIYKNIQRKQAIEERIAMVPEFSLQNLKGKTMLLNSRERKTPLILTYFDTDCHFCQNEVRSMKQHERLKKNVVIYLISGEPADSLKQFKRVFELKSIQILKDSALKAKEWFGVRGVPTTFVYGKEGTLLKYFEGETKASTLYQLIKKNKSLVIQDKKTVNVE